MVLVRLVDVMGDNTVNASGIKVGMKVVRKTDIRFASRGLSASVYTISGTDRYRKTAWGMYAKDSAGRHVKADLDGSATYPHISQLVEYTDDVAADIKARIDAYRSAKDRANELKVAAVEAVRRIPGVDPLSVFGIAVVSDGISRVEIHAQCLSIGMDGES